MPKSSRRSSKRQRQQQASRQEFADRSFDDHGHCLGTRPPGGAGATYLKLHVANGLDVPHHLFLQADENPYIFGRIWRKNSEAARSDLLAGWI